MNVSFYFEIVRADNPAVGFMEESEVLWPADTPLPRKGELIARSFPNGDSEAFDFVVTEVIWYLTLEEPIGAMTPARLGDKDSPSPVRIEARFIDDRGIFFKGDNPNDWTSLIPLEVFIDAANKIACEKTVQEYC